MTDEKFQHRVYGYGVDKDGKRGFFSVPASQVKRNMLPAYSAEYIALMRKMKADIESAVFGKEGAA